MIKKLRPQYLKNGDKAIIISPSGDIDPVYINGAKNTLESWGLQVDVARFACEKYGRYGGTPQQRLSDLQSAMDDPEIKLIFCSRGGYGVVQFVDELNFEGIKKHPKWLLGFSDITALHLSFLKNNLVSIHSSMAKHLTENSNDETSLLIKQNLFGEINEYSVPAHELNHVGTSSGYLFGGNLAVLCGLIGTPYMQVYENGIFFIEDISESPYKIDRMMWQLKLSGILSRISGLVVGQFTDCNEDPSMGATIYESIHRIVAEYKYPVVFNFPIGHVELNYPLIHGSTVNLEVKKNIVTLKNKD